MQCYLLGGDLLPYLNGIRRRETNTVVDSIGPEFILAILSNGIYLGGKRGFGYGLCQLVDYQVLGDMDSCESWKNRPSLSQDSDVSSCRERLAMDLNGRETLTHGPTPVAGYEFVPGANEEESQAAFDAAGEVGDEFAEPDA